MRYTLLTLCKVLLYIQVKLQIFPLSLYKKKEKSEGKVNHDELDILCRVHHHTDA